ncbi:MAG: hypothetical protein KDC54_19090, partial [Lewinella sp.]|nr:hypothetical protein [Lewinella sp.]
MRTQLSLLLLFVMIFLPKIVTSQPHSNQVSEEIACPYFLSYDDSKNWDFEQRKVASETLIDQAKVIIQGTVVQTEPIILNDTLFVEIKVRLEHV